MKFLSTSALTLALIGEALGETWPFVGKKDVKPVYRDTAKRVVLSYGPIVLYGKDEKKPLSASMSMDPKGQAGIGTINNGLCSKCTLLSGRFALRYKDGSEATPATGVYIHHMLSFDTGKTSKNPISGGTIGGIDLISRAMAAFIDRGEDSVS